MSCNCQNTADASQFPCHCDDFVFPAPLEIGAGLTDIPRQIGGFLDFRRDMLYTLRSKQPLAAWHATKPDDMGLMLLEMWAYVCDVVCFYDKVIAEELYIGLAQQRPSLRKLVALLGYLPTPAVAATAKLAAKASGRQVLTVPAGTAFRSGAFDGNPPQVFELGLGTVIDPVLNNWNVVAPHAGIVTMDHPSALLVTTTLVPNAGDLVLLVDTADAGRNLGLVVSGTGKVQGGTQISFTTPTNLLTGKPLNQLRLLLPRNTANIIKEINGSNWSAIELSTVARQIKVGDLVLVSGTKDVRWYDTLRAVQETNIAAPTTVTINNSTFSTPGPATPVTVLHLDAPLTDATRGNPGITGGSPASWSDPATAQLILHFNLQSIGTITDLPNTLLNDTDPLFFTPPVVVPAESVAGELLVQDVNGAGAALTGTVNFGGSTGAGSAELSLNASEGWTPGLVLPVQVFGNVLDVSRGQTVSGEILGNGDATQVNQTFKLQKKPLTYLPAATATNNSGVKNTLTVYIDGVRWSEVPSFYGRAAGDQVYIVRQNDDGDSLVVFGDGVRGQRVSTGVSNIIGNYRYGAGLAAPPAGSINQIAKAVKGLQSVSNVTAAGAGADAEGPDTLRGNAPKTALILGRAVSIDDMEAVALAWPGVVAAQTEWRWEQDAQTALVHVWYIGDPGLADSLKTRLQGLSDPTVDFQVDNAMPRTVNLVLSVDVDPRYVTADVHAAVSTALTGGLLATGYLGVGNPLFRSQLFEAVLAIAGTTAVSGIYWNYKPFTEFAKTPGSGHYFDFTLSI
jgi:hypothetical protein